MEKNISDGLKRAYSKNPKSKGMLGKHLNEITKNKISNAMKDPTKNNMFGKCWIHNVETLEFKIWPKEKELPIGQVLGRKPHKDFIPKNPTHPNLQYTWISKANEHKYVRKSELEIWIYSGWHKGRK